MSAAPRSARPSPDSGRSAGCRCCATHGRDRTVAESSIIIEYLALYHPGVAALLPTDPTQALDTRARDRFFDLYVNEPVGKIVTNKLRPPGKGDPHGVEQARRLLRSACDRVEADLCSRPRAWAIGETFTMADCAAAPALFYAHLVQPLTEHPHTAAYLGRLRARPSFARAIRDAEPYMPAFPGG